MLVVPTVSKQYRAKMADGTWRTVTCWGLHLGYEGELMSVCGFHNQGGYDNGVRASIPVRLLEDLDG